MTAGAIVVDFNAATDHELDYVNKEWSRLLKHLREHEDDPHVGLFRSLVEVVRDALNAETEVRLEAGIARELQEIDDIDPEDFA